MSYILDALKKSDRSRQLNTTHDIQISTERTPSGKNWKLPVLLSLFLVLVVAAVLAMQRGWFERAEPPATKIVASGSGETKQEREEVEPPNTDSQKSAGVVSLNSVAQRLERNKKVDPVRIKQAERRSLQSLVGDNAAEQKVDLAKSEPIASTPSVEAIAAKYEAEQRVSDNEPIETALQERANQTEYPNYRSIQGSLSGLGEMHLDILAYHPEAAERKAYINMQKYYEGDTTAEGGRIIEIRPDGAVMDYRGREFILTAK